MHCDMLGLAALDLILGIVLVRVMGMSLVVNVFGMNFDDRAAHMARLRIAGHVIADFETFRHHELLLPF